MAIDFPASPTTGQTYQVNNQVWVYDGTVWKSGYESSGYVQQSFTATAGQTTFTITGGYAPSLVSVFLNGVRLVNGVDVTVTSGTNVVLATGASAGDVIDVIGWAQITLASPTTIANGGTGATDAATARANLGLAIGTNVQAWDANLDQIAALAPTADNFIVGDGTVWTLESAQQAAATMNGFTTTATAAGTTTLTNTSTLYQLFTGTSTQTVVLPVTSTLTLGWSFHIVNNSTGNVTVNSSGANAVIVIPPGTTAMVTCILTSGTTAASWEAGLTDFSTYTGTGSVMLNVNPTVTNYTETVATSSAGSLTINLANGTIFRHTLTASGTITLPASVAGKSFILIVIYNGAFTITWAGGSTLKWSQGIAPAQTSATGKIDVFSFFQDGTNTYGCLMGYNY